MNLRVRLAARVSPIVDVPLGQVFTDELQVVVALRVAGHAPLHPVFRHMTVTQQDTVQACVGLCEAVHGHDFCRDHAADVVADR